MSLEVNRVPGPNFRQRDVPADTSLGNLWFNTAGGNLAMANGAGSYGGDVERVGIAGYSVGGGTGQTGPAVSTIDKLVFLTDTNSSIVSGLTSPRLGSAGFASLIAGYATGGYTGSAMLSQINKLVFSGEACSTVSGVLSAARYWIVVGFNSSLAGYSCGGYTGSYLSVIDKLLFSADTNSAIVSTLSIGRNSTIGFESGSAGYTAGGTTAIVLSVIDKLVFSTDANASLATGLLSLDHWAAGFASPSAGYKAAGNSVVYLASISRLNFANDAVASLTATVGTARYTCAGYNSYVAGYCAGGTNGSNLTLIDKLSFATEADSLVGSGLSSARGWMTGFEHLNAPLGSA